MLTLTDQATDRLKQLLQEEDDPGTGLRIEVVPGGCSGFEYSLSLGAREDGDEVVDSGGARVYIDKFSIPYLLGSEFDYEESFQGAGFVINNPNASASCGCGKSFQAG
jgi:iron-sulfur cluster assembly accessory protein